MKGEKCSHLRWAILGFSALGLMMASGNTPALAKGHGHGDGNAFGVHNLHGRYIAAGNAADASITDGDSDDDAPARAFVAGGFLKFDGNGNITAGEETINYGVPGSGDSFTCELAGTYTVDSATGRTILTLNVTPGPAVTAAEGPTTPPNNNTQQCSGTDTVVGYIGGPSGKQLATVEQTVVPGTPPSGIAADTPILSAHIWAREGGD
jgi:hypothetical protein